MARRPAGRHVRRVRKRTPRRWLPFLALSALVAGAVVAEKDPERAAPPAFEDAADPVILPSVAEVGAISTAWYCGAGTAQGEEGLAELSIVIANAEATGAQAEVTVVTDEGKEARTEVEVPARGRARVNTWELLSGAYVAATVEVRGGRAVVEREVTGPDGFDTSPCSSTAADTWFVPSGSTLRGAEQYLYLYNPFPDDASVDVDFDTDRGTRAPRAWTSYTVPGRSLKVLQVSEEVDERRAVATRVRARSGRLVVDRLQTYDGEGDEVEVDDDSVSSAPPIGVVATSGIPAAAPRWVFPGARISPVSRSQVAIYNPSDEEAEVDLVIWYQDPEMVPFTDPLQVDVPAGKQRVVDLSEAAGLLPDQDFVIDVRSLQGVPVVAERLSFWTRSDDGEAGGDGGEQGAEVDPGAEGEPGAEEPEVLPRADDGAQGAGAALGSPAAATRWMIAQGGPGTRRTASAIVANLGARDAKVTVRQLVGGTVSEVASATITVPAGDARTLDLTDAEPGATLVIESSEPIVASSFQAARNGRGVTFSSAAPFPETVGQLPATD